MIDGLVDHVERFLGELVGEWDTDPDGNELPFRIVHYDGMAPPGTEIYSTLGLSDYPLGEDGARIEFIVIAPARLTPGTVPPILVAAGELPIDVNDVPQVGDTFRSIDALREVSPMDCLYVGRPLYQAPELNSFDHGDGEVRFLWLIPIYEEEADFTDQEGWQAFERLMWELDVDPTDFSRDPWIQ